MGWIWSDDLADTLERSPELAPLIPAGWTTRPCAFALDGDEDAGALGRRLLGLPGRPIVPEEGEPTACSCGAGP